MQPEKEPTAVEIRKIGAMPMNFVVGKERSGTTLLQLMLNAHKNIVAPPESRFIMLLYFRYGKIKVWTEKVIINFCDDFFKEGLVRNLWSIDKMELQSTLTAFKELLSFPLVCKIIFRMSNPAKKEIYVFFDKNPVYYYFLNELNRIFPEAKYIHLVRDYRANIVSHRRVFNVKKGIDIAYRWKKVNMLIEKAKKRSPEKFYTLTYESLVSNPEKKMDEVCNFLNLPYDKNMAQDHQSGMSSKFKFSGETKERFRMVHEKVFTSINPSLINEWKEKISPEELAEIESIAGKYAEIAYGYKLVNPETKTKINSLLYFKTAFKYWGIKNLYRILFNKLWLYYKIKRNIWKNF